MHRLKKLVSIYMITNLMFNQVASQKKIKWQVVFLMRYLLIKANLLKVLRSC